LGHAKRISVFASTLQVAPRCEAAGKPRKVGKAAQHPSLTRANANAVAVAAACIDASALRSQYPRGADQENLPLVLNSSPVRLKAESAARPLFTGFA